MHPGGSLGKYQIVCLIGRGGMGAVYLAEDQTLGRRVALKVLHRALSADESFLARFRGEARVIAGLDHPNILRIHALESIGEDLVIDMAFVDGGSLENAEAAGDLTMRQALLYFRDVLHALAACHAVHLVHRDVKPSNILLAKGGQAFLSDFGLAQMLTEHQVAAMAGSSSSTLFLGTPRYAPPESWEDAPPTPAGDVYSVGAALYEALASRLPYDARTPLALIKQIADHPVPPLKSEAPHISTQLSDLVSEMLARDPDDRPQNAGEVLRRFQATPELEGTVPTETSTVVLSKRRLPLRVPWRRRWREWRNKRQFSFWFAGLLTFLIAAVGITSALLGPWTTSAFVQHETTPVRTVDEPRAPSPLVFDTVDAATHDVWPNQWLMSPADGPGEWDALAADSIRLWFVHLAPDRDGTYALQGVWAQYADPTARYFSHGTLQGESLWLEPDKTMAVRIDFRDEQDGSRWSDSFTMKSPQHPLSELQFTRKLEAEDAIQPILYNELLPREIPWAETVERRFIGPVASWISVPFVLSEESDKIHIDGHLDEPMWRPVVSSGGQEVGGLECLSEPRGAEMLVRYSPSMPASGLLIGLRGPQRLHAPQVSIALLNHFSVPVSRSARWLVELAGATVTEAHHWEQGCEIPWECRWEGRSCIADTGWEVEVLVPAADLGPDPGLRPEQRWRINCSVRDGQAQDSRPLASWGFEDLTKVEHGVILALSRIFTPAGGS
ncbi:MAG TPA: serine/threonine-protein kinase [Candidatus Hydrogenedentes bacterium]|nr:serine/threonine-protein kinase [Candidatus Hydrogenedentota bacterium]